MRKFPLLLLVMLFSLGSWAQAPGSFNFVPRDFEELSVGGGTHDPLNGGHDWYWDGSSIQSREHTFGTPTTSIQSAIFPHGVAHSSPTNGGVWTTTAGLFVRINGVTIGPLLAATVSVPDGGTGANSLTDGGMLFGSGTGAITALDTALDGQLPIGTTASADPVLNEIDGTAGRITVTNGAGTITLDIDAAYVGQTSITTLSTVVTGTWNATVIVPTYGGTGLATILDHGVMVGSGTGNVTPLAVGATNELLLGGTGADPTWGVATDAHVSDTLTASLFVGASGNTTTAVDLDGAEVAGILSATKGGTGTNFTYVIGDLLFADSPTTLATRAAVAAGQVFVSGGVGVAPAWSGTPTVATLTTTGLITAGTDVLVLGDNLYADDSLVLSGGGISTSQLVLSSDGLSASIGTSAVAGTLNVSAALGGKLSLSDPGFTHPVTAFVPANTYFYIEEANDNVGSARVWGVSSSASVNPFSLFGIFGVTNPDDDIPALDFAVGKSNGGTGLADLSADETALVVSGASTGTVLFELMGNGDLAVIGDEVIEGGDLTIGSAGAGNIGTSDKPGQLQFASITSTLINSDLTVNLGATTDFNLGQEDTHRGIVSIFGGGANSGSRLSMFNPANSDAATDSWLLYTDFGIFRLDGTGGSLGDTAILHVDPTTRGVTFNPDGENQDFIVESVNVPEMLKVDAALDTFAIGGDTTISGSLFLLEQADAVDDVAGSGQFWVRNDTPNTPMFTDDDGNDHVLHSPSFSNLEFNKQAAAGDTIGIGSQDVFVLITSFENVGKQDDLGNMTGNATTDLMTVGPMGGGIYDMAYHISGQAVGASVVMFAVGVTHATPLDITNADDNADGDPVTITVENHGLLNGDMVRIAGITDKTEANGDWIVTSVADDGVGGAADTFDLVVLDGTATTNGQDYNEGSPTGDVTIVFPQGTSSISSVTNSPATRSGGGDHSVFAGDTFGLYIANLTTTQNWVTSTAHMNVTRDTE